MQNHKCQQCWVSCSGQEWSQACSVKATRAVPCTLLLSVSDLFCTQHASPSGPMLACHHINAGAAQQTQFWSALHIMCLHTLPVKSLCMRLMSSPLPCPTTRSLPHRQLCLCQAGLVTHLRYRLYLQAFACNLCVAPGPLTVSKLELILLRCVCSLERLMLLAVCSLNQHKLHLCCSLAYNALRGFAVHELLQLRRCNV